MDDAKLLFNIFYLVLYICLIYPPAEFISVGFTVEGVFSSLIGTTEKVNFVQYHQRRTVLNLIVHGSMPAVFFWIHKWKFIEDSDAVGWLWNLADCTSIALLAVIIAIVNYWYLNNWQRHPVSRALKKFSNDEDYELVASNVDVEVRRDDMLKIKTSTIVHVISTENWIMKTTPYTVYIAHQSDTSLEVGKTDTFNVAENTTDLVQMLNIDVKSNREGVKPFQIRINALDFRMLQDRLQRPITIPPHIQFHRNQIDHFIEVFKEQVALNQTYRTDQVADKCFACMIADPNIKLHKQCIDVDEENRPLATDKCCDNCYCRPMWCVECLARWFAARQADVEKELWLQQKCSCPLCRAKFCVLDVCYIEKVN